MILHIKPELRPVMLRVHLESEVYYVQGMMPLKLYDHSSKRTYKFWRWITLLGPYEDRQEAVAYAKMMVESGDGKPQ